MRTRFGAEEAALSQQRSPLEIVRMGTVSESFQNRVTTTLSQYPETLMAPLARNHFRVILGNNMRQTLTAMRIPEDIVKIAENCLGFCLMTFFQGKPLQRYIFLVENERSLPFVESITNHEVGHAIAFHHDLTRDARCREAFSEDVKQLLRNPDFQHTLSREALEQRFKNDGIVRILEHIAREEQDSVSMPEDPSDRRQLPTTPRDVQRHLLLDKDYTAAMDEILADAIAWQYTPGGGAYGSGMERANLGLRHPAFPLEHFPRTAAYLKQRFPETPTAR